MGTKRNSKMKQLESLIYTAEKFSKEEALMVVKVAPLLKLQIRGHVIIDFDATRIRTVYNFC
jgi:hypothetical protein